MTLPVQSTDLSNSKKPNAVDPTGKKAEKRDKFPAARASASLTQGGSQSIGIIGYGGLRV